MKNIFLIDDDSDDLELLRDAIAAFYGQTNCASFVDPDAALKSILSNIETPPDIVFIDINMPKLTGDMCLQILRKELALDQVVIVMISTSMDSENQVFLLRQGADFAFKKPYKIEEYRQVVLQVLHYDKSRSPDSPGSFF